MSACVWVSAQRGARSDRHRRVITPGWWCLVIFIFLLYSLVLLNSVYNHCAQFCFVFPPKQGSS